MPTSLNILRRRSASDPRRRGHDRQRREFTGVPWRAALAQAGLNHRAAHVRGEGWDRGVPPTAKPGRHRSITTKGCRWKKPCTPIPSWPGPRTASCWNICTVRPSACSVPGWSGNWSVNGAAPRGHGRPPDCWYHWQFYYYGTPPMTPTRNRLPPSGCVLSSPSTRRSDHAAAWYACHPWTGLEWRRGHYAGGGECGRWLDLACGPS